MKTAIAVMALISSSVFGLEDTVFDDATTFQQERIIEAQAGDIASGRIVVENDSQLRLATDACTGSGDTIVFYPPYVKTLVGQVNCGNGTVDRYQIEKK